MLGPWFALAAILGLLVGLYVITDVSAALYAIIGVVLLLPFGVFPVKIAITPTLLDLALGGFLLVYLFQWMTGRRGRLRLTPVHALVAAYVMWLVLAFALGLRHASPTAAIIRQFAETMLSIGMVFILTDLLRSPSMLRRLVLVIILAIGAQALLATALYIAPDALAEALLVRLSRIGYPPGGVIPLYRRQSGAGGAGDRHLGRPQRAGWRFGDSRHHDRAASSWRKMPVLPRRLGRR